MAIESMNYCGIELKGNDAVLVCIRTIVDGYELVTSKTKKIGLALPDDQQAVRLFASSIADFIDSNEIRKIGIKERARKGKFAGGPSSFKMEGIIQTLATPVELIHTATIKSKLSEITIDDAALHSYQSEALRVAICLTKL